MFELKRDNVVKIVDSEAKKAKLISQGFTLISESEGTNEKPDGKKKAADKNTASEN